jgi:hypothetical protein
VKKYSINGLSASSTGPKTAATIIGATTVRPLLSEFSVGVRTNPNATDQQVEYAVGSTSTVGTAGSNPTPKPLDLADPIAAQCTAGITHSAEPTYDTGYWFDTDLNQRGAFRWVAEIGFEMAGAATTSHCVAVKLVGVTAAAQISSPLHWKE